MHFFLLLCFWSQMGFAQVPFGENCTKSFLNVILILNYKQAKVQEICSKSGEVAKVQKTLQGVLEQCGISDWTNKYPEVAPMIKGIFDFIMNLLCENHENVWCYPHSIKIIDIVQLIKVVNTLKDKVDNDFSWDALDLECKIFSNPDKIKDLCPMGDYNSGGAKCIRNTIQKFDQGLLRIRKTLRGRSDIQKILEPISKFAKNIRCSCNTRVRTEIVRIFHSKCFPPTPSPTTSKASETPTPAPTPVIEETDDDIKDKLCVIKENGKNHLRDDVARMFNILAVYEIEGVTLPRGRFITRDEIENICCDATCRKKSVTIVTVTIKKSFTSPTTNLCNRFKNANAQEKKKMEVACCKSTLSESTGKLSRCTCKLGCSTKTSRRLLNTHDLNAEVKVNGTDGQVDIANCVTTGSQFALNLAFDDDSMNSTTNIVLNNCTCSPNCENPSNSTSSPTPSPTSSPTSRPTSSPTTTTTIPDSSMKLSYSFVGLLLSSLFFISTSFGK